MEMILRLVGETGLELFISIPSLDLVDIIRIKYWFVIFIYLFVYSLIYSFIYFAEGVLLWLQWIIPPSPFPWRDEDGELWDSDVWGRSRACWEPPQQGDPQGEACSLWREGRLRRGWVEGQAALLCLLSRDTNHLSPEISHKPHPSVKRHDVPPLPHCCARWAVPFVRLTGSASCWASKLWPMVMLSLFLLSTEDLPFAFHLIPDTYM